MRKPQPNTLPVIKIPLDEDEGEITFTVLFDCTKGAYFSIYATTAPGSREPGGPFIVTWDSKGRLQSQLLDEVWPGLQLAYLVYEFGGVDHEPAGRVILNLLGRGGSLKNGCITIDIPRCQVAAGYIEFVDNQQGRDEEDDEVDDEDEEG